MSFVPPKKISLGGPACKQWHYDVIMLSQPSYDLFEEDILAKWPASVLFNKGAARNPRVSQNI